MFLNYTMAASVAAFGVYNIYLLGSVGAWVNAILVGIFAVVGLFEWAYLRKRESAAVASRLLGWAVASQLMFSFMASTITEQVAHKSTRNSTGLSK